MILLQNAISGVSTLHNVKTQAAHDIAHGQPPLTYDTYLVLLLIATTIEDEKLGFTCLHLQCTIHRHEQYLDSPDVDQSFHIDTNINKIEINASYRKPPHKNTFRPSMARDQWHNLSADDKVIWDS